MSDTPPPIHTSPVTVVRPDPKVDPSGQPQQRSRARTTVVGCVYHARDNSEPTAVELGHTRFVEHDEQPYLRELTLPPGEWQTVDVGWLSGKVGLLVFKVAKGNGVVTVGVSYTLCGVDLVQPFAEVRPGQSLPFTPFPGAALHVKADQSSRVTAYVYHL